MAKGNSYEYLYRPLLERNLETYQVQYLARSYDFGRQSRVAVLIVREINARMQEAEEQLGIGRVAPFHLYLKRSGVDLALPLFRPQYLEPILKDSGGFRASRHLVLAECQQRARRAGADRMELLGPIDASFFLRHRLRRKAKILPSPGDTRAESGNRLRELIRRIHTRSAFERLDGLDTGAPRSLVERLSRFVQPEGGRGPTVSTHLVEEVIALRAVCCPRVRHLKSGEMPFLATSVNAHLSEEVATRFRRLKPVILTVWSAEELAARPWDNPNSDRQLAERMVRVCFEAYRQGGLLSLMDLQWIFQTSSRKVSELLRWAQKTAALIVPTPGTVLDAGRSMTHKDIVVGLHLEGYTVREIARRTFHSPRAVDNYIGTFESVLILNLYHVPKRLMARILRKGISLIEEHLELARQHFRTEEEMKRLLAWKEVVV